MVIGSFDQLPFYYQFFLISKKLNLRYRLGKSNVAYFYLNRPQAHNALNMELIREMRQALKGGPSGTKHADADLRQPA